ncbi:hypothetical protein L2E82_03240 [Cichorium intybus]|uniref:Uncharacterized protein n=1 Tax=Cichorium intybus TaxID=13427 RepID=A0ACB9H548_CICIN|nr:hypothetical protein L2E82_03240 [Cichorium intybus]
MHTSRWPEKLLIRHRKYPSKEDYYTLHSEDQLPLCPRRGYFGIRPVMFPYKRCYDIIGSCNGILCLYDYGKHSISLWNPSIRRKLPVPDCPDQRLSSWIPFGFGFDPIANDYKIVGVLSNSIYGENPKSSFVYSMKTGAWCAIASPSTPFNWKYANSKAHCVNGTLHWVLGYMQSRLVDFTAASFRIVEMVMCSESLGLLDMGTACEGN